MRLQGGCYDVLVSCATMSVWNDVDGIPVPVELKKDSEANGQLGS